MPIFTMVFVWTYGSTSPLCKIILVHVVNHATHLLQSIPSLQLEPRPPANFISSIGPDPFGSLRSPLTKLKNLCYNEYSWHSTAQVREAYGNFYIPDLSKFCLIPNVPAPSLLCYFNFELPPQKVRNA